MDVMVDGYGIGDVGSSVLKDRKTLSQAGLITIAVALDRGTGSLMAVPELRTRGFVYVQENQDLLDEAISIVYNTIGRCTEENALDEAALSRAIKSDMKKFIYGRTKRTPMIIPMILYV
jgi:ribonuclease J